MRAFALQVLREGWPVPRQREFPHPKILFHACHKGLGLYSKHPLRMQSNTKVKAVVCSRAVNSQRII
jgi:hypothetical protein